ncbi:MAG TPA: hypothetical protein RMF84_12735, partial [Polyangiaceae bacterium LLY-WYZ-14_1]|nr:hypothetical protein [Polyangiaceae bacterium LLY-WYZ-14_1]
MASPKRAGPAREPEPTEDPVPAGTRPAARWGDRAALGLLPAGVAVAFGALLVFQPGPPEADLQLVAPGSTAPGASLGVRAFVFHDLEAPSGPSLIDRGAVHLSLGPPAPRDTALGSRPRDPWVRARMAATPLDTFEASLEVPPDLPLGPAVLVARSDQVEHVTRLPIVLARAPDPVALRPRELPRLARFRAGPLRPASARGRPPDSGETADAGPGRPPMPVPFEVRVPGGACVPEIPCTLLVHVGAPAAAVTLDLG